MPGKSPAEAVEAFLAPLRLALSTVARAKITVPRGGLNPPVGAEQVWTLNNGASVTLTAASRPADQPQLPRPLAFHAAMYWKVIRDEREDYGPFRVSTTGYSYSMLAGPEQVEVWAMHWHATGVSDETKPHMHFGVPMLDNAAPVSKRDHMPTGRMTFEDAIRWLVKCGARPLVDNWTDRLALAEAPHLLFRSWSSDPDVRHDATQPTQ